MARHRPCGSSYARFKLKQQLSEAQNHRCCYCHVHFSDDRTSPYYATYEHVIPISHGGTNELSNLVVACYTCNITRGNRYSAEDFSNIIHHGHLEFLMDKQTDGMNDYA